MAAAGGRAPVVLSVDQRALVDAARALRSEVDGKLLRKTLIRELKATGEASVGDLRASAMSIPSKGLTQGQPLRATLARRTTTTVRLSGRLAGVSLSTKRTPELRGFTMAGRRMNRDVGFNHRVYGRGGVHQVGKPGWFDDVAPRRKDEFEADVLRVVQDLADTLAARAAARR